MVRSLMILALATAAMAQSPAPAGAPAASTRPSADALQASAPAAPAPHASLPAVMGTLPALPHGKSTVIGGEIVHIDPVLDRFTLKVFGGGTMKILFDARTQVFLNGNKISFVDLHKNEHASVETTLDGSRVFALRVHMLTRVPQGECEGQVVSYDPSSGQLTVNTNLSQQPITLEVPSNTPIVRVGETTFAGGQGGTTDLAPGSLVRITFTAGGTGHGIAQHIDVLATNGSDFIFGGVLTSLDIANGQMSISDPRDSNTYQVFFNPDQFPVVHSLHIGSHLRVTARFDGRQYVATAISAE